MNVNLRDKLSHSTGDVAKLLGCNIGKVGELIRRGELAAINTAISLKGHRPRYRILATALDDFLRRRSIVPPPPVQRRQRREALAVPNYLDE